MNQDRQQELERLEKELLEQEAEPVSDEELLKDIQQFFLDEEKAAADIPAEEPAFDDPQTIHEPKEPLVYRNFSNGYGHKSPQPTTDRKKEKSERIDTGLMIAASALALGIIGVLIYWLVVFL